MDRTEVTALLESVAAGDTSIAAAIEVLATAPYADLGFARVDHHRGLRTGDPEVVYAAGKTAAETVAIVHELRSVPGSRATLVTRLDELGAAALRAAFQDAAEPFRLDVPARAALIGSPPEARGLVCVVSAGTSDGPVAAEAALTARAFGSEVVAVNDVGVAGLHRLLAARATLDAADVVIVVAGMEGALPSVIGGLIAAPVIAVPTSVGYGASFGGLAALLAMLNSCAPGVVVTNIDNGFGAGVFAARVARRKGSPE
ncbi:MAG: nickel pincer cofactor biosynthesis protein LarB [Mycobacteriales bacterium]